MKRSNNVLASAVFENNHYFKGGDNFISSDYEDRGINRDFSDWILSVESTAASSGFHGTNLQTGLLSSTSNLVGMGSKNASANRDYNGRHFEHKRPIGAFVEYSTKTNGLLDTDNDGLSNDIEIEWVGDATSVDYDDFLFSLALLPLDSDGDGVSDEIEMLLGGDPNNPADGQESTDLLMGLGEKNVPAMGGNVFVSCSFINGFRGFSIEG